MVCMGGSNTSADSDGAALTAAVASILGVKGNLRFRPHGSSQKAHVILRRVPYSDDSSDDGEANRVVRFSLFAHKRIEVKPGKEILLTIDTEDGLFKDTPIVLEGDLPCVDGSSDEEETTQVAEQEEEYYPPLKQAIPPKMRRAWTKRIEEVNSISPESIPRVSIGVQAAAEYASASTQAEHFVLSTSTQTDHPISPPPPPSFQQLHSMDQTSSQPWVKIEFELEDTLVTSRNKSSCGNSVGGEEEMDMSASPQRERSLSPMELDSPSITPPLSPSKFTFPPSPSHDTSLKQTSSQPASIPNSASRTESAPSEPPTLSSIIIREGASSICDKLSFSPEEAKGSILQLPSSRRLLDLVSQPTASSHSPTPNLSAITPNGKKPGTYNMFVPATLPTRPKNPLDVNSVSRTASPPSIERSERSIPPLNTLNQSALSTSQIPISQATVVSQPPVATKATPVAQNAVASSSKVSLESLDRPIIPTEPRLLASFTSRSQGKAPAHFEKGNASRSVKSPSSPPPDAKALAYIPAGSSVNPLGIRPSAMPAALRAGVMDRPPPTAPKSLTNPAKKPVLVGSNWSAGRANNIPTSNPATAVTPSSSQTQKPLKQPDRMQIFKYSSLSPPPPPESDPPPPAPPPPPKWKPLATPTQKSLNQSRKSMISDFSASVPPSPDVLSTMPLPQDNRSRLEALSTVPLMKTSQLVSTSSGHPQQPNGHGATQDAITVKNGESSANASTVPLKDRISSNTGASKLAAPPKPACNGNRALLSRVFDIPSGSPEPTVNETKEAKKSISTPAALMQPSPVPLLTGVPLPTNHPLPPKPVQAVHTGSSYRGVKRDRALTPEPHDRRRNKRTFDWPTVDSNMTKTLEGDGDRGVRSIAFSSDGNYFVLSCADRTIRIWNNRARAEIARLSHNSAIISTIWLDGDAGVITLTDDGLVSKWTRNGDNQWKWAKILDAGNEFRSDQDSICFAYLQDRIAVSFPRMGVKVWIWCKGTWQAQRSILRQNVTAIKFIDDGAALIGGTRDGALWYCEIPNGTLRAYAFFKTKIISLDVSPTGIHALVNQVGSSAYLVSLRQSENKGMVEQTYSFKDTHILVENDFGAVFATKGQAILFGNVEGCVLVWDKKKGAIVYGLEHDEDDCIGAAATFDGTTGKDGCMITGTKHGQICWWSQPVAAPQSQVEDFQKKRQKVS